MIQQPSTVSPPTQCQKTSQSSAMSLTALIDDRSGSARFALPLSLSFLPRCENEYSAYRSHTIAFKIKTTKNVTSHPHWNSHSFTDNTSNHAPAVRHPTTSSYHAEEAVCNGRSDSFVNTRYKSRYLEPDTLEPACIPCFLR